MAECTAPKGVQTGTYISLRKSVMYALEMNFL